MNQPNDQENPDLEIPWINEVIQKIEYRQKELSYYKSREIEENWWRFFIIDRFQKIKYKDKSDSQKLEYQLSTLGSYIKITEKVIRVTLKWDDLWEKLLKVLLIPIEGITFDIRLVFSDINWEKFTETFIKIFASLKESGSKISYIHFKKESIGGIKFSDDADSLLEQLKFFNIKNIKVENCVLSKSLIQKFFQIKSSQTMWLCGSKNESFGIKWVKISRI